jgi:hypothetical protein
MVRYISSPYYALVGTLSPSVGNIDSFVRKLKHFILLIKDTNLQNGDALASFDVVSLFTNVPEALYGSHILGPLTFTSQ